MRCVVSWRMGVDGPPEGLDPVEVARRGRELMRSGNHATWLVNDVEAGKTYAVDLSQRRIIPPGRPPDDDEEQTVGDSASTEPRDDDEPPF